jgi:hypothetical protein
VTARNSVGISEDSEILLILAAKAPDSPINLAYVPEESNDSEVSLTWADGAYDGASPVIDYTVSYTEESANTYQVFASGVANPVIVVNGLTPGETYKFVVQSRNLIDLSEYSDSITVLAA